MLARGCQAWEIAGCPALIRAPFKADWDIRVPSLQPDCSTPLPGCQAGDRDTGHPRVALSLDESTELALVWIQAAGLRERAGRRLQLKYF